MLHSTNVRRVYLSKNGLDIEKHDQVDIEFSPSSMNIQIDTRSEYTYNYKAYLVLV